MSAFNVNCYQLHFINFVFLKKLFVEFFFVSLYFLNVYLLKMMSYSQNIGDILSMDIINEVSKSFTQLIVK